MGLVVFAGEAFTQSPLTHDHALVADILEAVRTGGRLHDIGKIGIREEILNKQGPLTPEERAVMRNPTNRQRNEAGPQSRRSWRFHMARRRPARRRPSPPRLLPPDSPQAQLFRNMTTRKPFSGDIETQTEISAILLQHEIEQFLYRGGVLRARQTLERSPARIRAAGRGGSLWRGRLCAVSGWTPGYSTATA